MKHTTKAIIALLIVSLLSSCSNTSVNYTDHLKDYVKTMEFHDNFVIAQFTDVHWSTGTDEIASRNYLNKVVQEIKNHYGKIDLIEFTGDQFMLSNAETVVDFLSWAEGLDIPYATTWGNHDIEGTYNCNWLSEQFLNAKNSLYTEVDYDNVHGRSNYIINLTNNDKVAWQLVHLDSGASFTDSAVGLTRSYDYIRQDQADWWKAEHDAVGDEVPVIAYYHIAQKEVVDAFDAVSQDSTAYYQNFYKEESFGNSKLDAAKEASPFFDIAKDHGLKAEFMGHCHSNDWTIDYQGVTLGFGVKTNAELYYAHINEEESKTTGGNEEFDLLGASCITLHEGGSFDLEHLYYNEKNNGDLIRWVNYR